MIYSAVALCASSDGSGETAKMHMLIWAFAAHTFRELAYTSH